MLLIEFSYLSMFMVLHMCIVPTEIFTDYSELFWDNGILFYSDVK